MQEQEKAKMVGDHWWTRDKKHLIKIIPTSLAAQANNYIAFSGRSAQNNLVYNFSIDGTSGSHSRDLILYETNAGVILKAYLENTVRLPDVR